MGSHMCVVKARVGVWADMHTKMASSAISIYRPCRRGDAMRNLNHSTYHTEAAIRGYGS